MSARADKNETMPMDRWFFRAMVKVASQPSLEVPMAVALRMPIIMCVPIMKRDHGKHSMMPFKIKLENWCVLPVVVVVHREMHPVVLLAFQKCLESLWYMDLQLLPSRLDLQVA
jgi:hypothetical protein